MFDSKVLDIDYAAEADRICEELKRITIKDLRKRVLVGTTHARRASRIQFLTGWGR